MPARSKKAKAVPFSAVDLVTMARANRYIQRVIEDAKLRDNVRSAVDSTRSAYSRLSNGKAPTKALLEDKKLQRDLRHAAEALRDATVALTAAPRRARKRRRLGRKLLILGLAAGLALAGSEKLRSKVLDTMFGAEEEFEYTPPPPPSTDAPPTTPVSAA
jgi:hypothetical protein